MLRSRLRRYLSTMIDRDTPAYGRMLLVRGYGKGKPVHAIPCWAEKGALIGGEKGIFPEIISDALRAENF